MKKTILLLIFYSTLTGHAQELIYKAIPKSHTTAQTSELAYISAPKAKLPVTEATLQSNEQHVAIYPNPAVDYLYLRSSTPEPINIEVVDILGQVVLSKETAENSIPVKSLPSGLYIANIYNKQDQLSQCIRFMKQ